MKRPNHTRVKTDSEVDVMTRSLPPTPKSASFNTATTPFVFDNGFLSFYTASPSSSDDSAPSFSPPSSSSASSFSGKFPDSPLPASPRLALQRLAIWRRGNETTPHLYADSSTNPRISGTVSLEHLDPLSRRYGPVQNALSQLFCPFLHVLFPLTVSSTRVVKGPYPTNSIVTISTPSRGPVHLMISTYNRGTLTYQSEVDMTEETPTFSGDTRYSAPLPRDFVDEVCKAVDCSCAQSLDMLDSIAVMRFIQQTDSAHGPYGRTIFGLVCDFQVHMGPFPSQIKLSHLSSNIRISQSVDSLPTPPPSRENQPDLMQPAPGFHQASIRQRSPGRVFPKLSVAIPPPSVRTSTTSRGLSQMCSDSFNAAPDRVTPLTGVPQSVSPVTPFGHHPSFHQPEQSHSTVRSYGGYGPSYTENTYRLTLSIASPSTAQFPAIGLIPVSPDPEESKRAQQLPLSLYGRSAQYGTTSSPCFSCKSSRSCPKAP